ncbi:MAG: hypothetical protein RL091_3324, partial [Verrucomicrobiota bacterium]
MKFMNHLRHLLLSLALTALGATGLRADHASDQPPVRT